MPMEDTYGIQSRIGSIIVVERWYCCRGSPVFSDRNIQSIRSFKTAAILLPSLAWRGLILEIAIRWPSFLKNGIRKAGNLSKISCWVVPPVGGGYSAL